MTVTVNYVSVIAAAVAYMALGYLWYSPYILGKPWMKLRKYTPAELKMEQSKMGPLYGITFVVALLTAYVLYHVMTTSKAFFGTDWFSTGLMAGFWSWLGFVMPTQVGNTIFGAVNSSSKWRLLAIDTGYQLAGLLVMGAVIGFIG